MKYGDFFGVTQSGKFAYTISLEGGGFEFLLSDMPLHPVSNEDMTKYKKLISQLQFMERTGR